MTRRSAPLLALACAALIGACGGNQVATTPRPSTVPDPPPTARQLAEIRSTPAAPFFWLGRSYGGQPLTRATLTASDPPDSIFQYGTPSCRAAIGCSYDLGVATVSERRPQPSPAQPCWRRLGPALVLGCDHGSSLQVYTGAVELFVSSQELDVVRVAGALRIKRTGITAGPRLDGLTAPKPFSCDEVKGQPASFRAAIPAELAPGSCDG